MAPEFGAQDDDEYESQCIHGKWDSEACIDCDTDEELQASGGDIYEDDDEEDDDEDDGNELAAT